ncbi:MAG: prepilin-type N-terminal cleavage/methylation domain-containing protein [Alteromonadaceae bacterium]|nr:prepilin-type N-terminal cleavage/methylation domain-containing protein [Alteromonadaceae bacterium]
MKAQRKNRGFTLIELVVVIAILAILAAFALPRFAQLSEQAHQSSIKGTSGALSAGVALVKAQWVSNGSTSAVAIVEGFGDFGTGEGVAVNDSGWPISTSGIAATPNQARCVEIWEGVMQSNAPAVARNADAGANPEAEYLATTANTSECVYTYQPDGLGSTITYDTADGSIVTDIQ